MVTGALLVSGDRGCQVNPVCVEAVVQPELVDQRQVDQRDDEEGDRAPDHIRRR